jgi:CubicO group peptidase (beta-lactamase class C family)
MLLSAFALRATAEDFTAAIHAYLQQTVSAVTPNGCIVVGIVDEHGSRIVSFGKLDNGTDQEANGDTVFAVHSATGTFTRFLLQDMVERGEMKLDDPVAKYLPKSVKVPTRNGKEITLRHLALERSGLPDFAESVDAKRADNPLVDYSIEQMDDFVSGCQLIYDPGAKYWHGRVDFGLLGQAMAQKASTDYESLMAERIFRPLKMDSTRFTPTTEPKSRIATEHDDPGFGYPIPNWDWGALKPVAGMYSTANDLLKFLSVNLGLTPSSLTSLMAKSAANFGYAPQGRGVFHTGGGSWGGGSYAGFDASRHRGVVILSTAYLERHDLGYFLLESEWQTGRRPTEANMNRQVYNSYVGQYKRSDPSIEPTSGILKIRQLFSDSPRTLICISTGTGLAVFVVLFSRARSSRWRWIIVGCTVLVSSLLAGPITRAFNEARKVPEPDIGIRRAGDRLFVQAMGSNSSMIELLPPIAGELLPTSETRYFERLSGMPVTFSRGDRGKVTGLTMHYLGNAFSFERISDEPPKAPERLKQPIVINVDTKLLDADVGHYEFPPTSVYPTGMKLKIWREGNQLVAQGWGQNVLRGPLDFYPKSEMDFFDKVYGLQLTFIKNDNGEVAAAIHRQPGRPDCRGKKIGQN